MESFSEPILRITRGENEGQRFEISQSRILIGRGATCDWIISSNKISREHLEIYWEKGHWWAKDLGSKNHSYLNESTTPITQPVKLKDGDKIQLAKVLVIQFYDPDATSAESTHHVLSNGLIIDPAREIVYINNRQLPSLPSQVYNLLFLLYQHQGIIVPNEKIAQALWGSDTLVIDLTATERNAIDKLFSRLSKILEKYDRSHRYIESVRGQGRRFVQKA